MILARVVGTVVSTRKEEKIKGIKFLLLEKIDPVTLQGKGDYLVAMDCVGAGKGEIVFYVSGSSARMTAITEGKPSDAAIVAIVDEIEVEGKVVYQKDAVPVST
ncbi:MAG: EutN/CcmL family microcompartment protein [Candidatus Caldatribacterium sp.]|uniref:EutN/CcmL family microcompartment protein n=1 Tax=Candidatus Caldatribacterium sp. TaxID=2282143 RepID=UPI0029926911|nr:EutN/CcmL family microcompartment protein [Candidatus Caldatribacterium sp.]MCX7730065.1 EutN/CcmL family microcompartment protein [Candidatus Caldatribacterium sp.]MDW8080920.1 EutN/CcmL family microcompartment protein [Candidatus Calescibacterium sp.]